jgi:hypothetical protein
MVACPKLVTKKDPAPLSSCRVVSRTEPMFLRPWGNGTQRFSTSGVLPRRSLFGEWHKFACRFIQAPIAGFPFSHHALTLTAVKFAKGRVLRDSLDNLVSERPPDPANWLVAFQGLSPHAVGPSIQIKELQILSRLVHPNGTMPSPRAQDEDRHTAMALLLTRTITADLAMLKRNVLPTPGTEHTANKCRL